MFICSDCITRYETWCLHVNRNLQRGGFETHMASHGPFLGENSFFWAADSSFLLVSLPGEKRGELAVW